MTYESKPAWVYTNCVFKGCQCFEFIDWLECLGNSQATSY